jgi:hypothetical protein
MSKNMGIYCKAYLLRDLRAFPGWSERSEAARPIEADDGSAPVPRELTDDDIVYVQEDHVVTDGIFKDENVIFDAVDEQWLAFCTDRLGFAIPEDVLRASEVEAA